MKRGILALVAIGLAILLVGPARAAMISVDFNDARNTGAAYTQPGFEEFEDVFQHATPPTSKTFGDIDLTLSGYQGIYRRGDLSDGGNFSYARLYNEAVYHKSNPITLTLSGDALEPDTDYHLRFFAFDNYDPDAGTFNTGRTIEMEYTPTGGTTGSSVSVFYDLDDSTPPDNYTYSTKGLFTSNSSGELVFSFSSPTENYSRAYLNGVVLTPEPSVAMLLSVVGLALLWGRKLRMKSA